MVYKVFCHSSNWFWKKCKRPSTIDSKKCDRADIKLLHCSNTTEVYNFSPQVYKTSAKLALDFDQIRITEADFVEAMCRLVPSTHRIQDQSQSPLVPRLRPLLASVVGEICQKIDEVNKGHEFSYRPRILIRARPGQCVSTYIGPAILHHLEKLPCHKLDIPALFSNSARYLYKYFTFLTTILDLLTSGVLWIGFMMRSG